jgi:hypothetical protein
LVDDRLDILVDRSVVLIALSIGAMSASSGLRELRLDRPPAGLFDPELDCELIDRLIDRPEFLAYGSDFDLLRAGPV